ncbi:hypothetical protein VTK56DRAFT_2012 [Thermocarpiscus australiensis]
MTSLPRGQHTSYQVRYINRTASSNLRGSHFRYLYFIVNQETQTTCTEIYQMDKVKDTMKKGLEKATNTDVEPRQEAGKDTLQTTWPAQEHHSSMTGGTDASGQVVAREQRDGPDGQGLDGTAEQPACAVMLGSPCCTDVSRGQERRDVGVRELVWLWK